MGLAKHLAVVTHLLFYKGKTVGARTMCQELHHRRDRAIVHVLGTRSKSVGIKETVYTVISPWGLHHPAHKEDCLVALRARRHKVRTSKELLSNRSVILSAGGIGCGCRKRRNLYTPAFHFTCPELDHTSCFGITVVVVRRLF